MEPAPARVALATIDEVGADALTLAIKSAVVSAAVTVYASAA